MYEIVRKLTKNVQKPAKSVRKCLKTYVKKCPKISCPIQPNFSRKITPKSYLLAELGGARALGVGAGCETPEFPSYAAKVCFSRSPLVLRAIF